ncbi:hypothetical protein C8J57DRAFT_1721470 [Mycena rebaudengoi]|nr:hypothetical protein C8J57DRAFT_1721470 [Mycena rebaudengoi]
MKGFEERAAPGGVYESFLAELKHEPDLLSNAELVGDVTLPANVFRVQQWGFNSASSDDHEAAARYYGIVIGEVTDASDGTLIWANGNHHEGSVDTTFKPVTDTNTPRHVIVLKAPTDAPAALTNIFDDQIAFGCELENIERSIDRKASKLNFTSYKSFLCSSTSDERNKDLIAIVTGKIYGVPAPAGAQLLKLPATNQSPQTQRVRRKRDGSEPDVVEEPKVPESQWRSADHADFKLPDENEVILGAYYDPRVYYNFNGPLYFQLEFALAPQLNISGHNKVLIPPWKLYNALHPGALIMAVVQISTCGFPEGSRIRKATLSFPAS